MEVPKTDENKNAGTLCAFGQKKHKLTWVQLGTLIWSVDLATTRHYNGRTL
jgi:hypothetical protein